MCYKNKRENSTQCFHALLRSHLSGKGGGGGGINKIGNLGKTSHCHGSKKPLDNTVKTEGGCDPSPSQCLPQVQTVHLSEKRHEVREAVHFGRWAIGALVRHSSCPHFRPNISDTSFAVHSSFNHHPQTPLECSSS